MCETSRWFNLFVWMAVWLLPPLRTAFFCFPSMWLNEERHVVGYSYPNTANIIVVVCTLHLPSNVPHSSILIQSNDDKLVGGFSASSYTMMRIIISYGLFPAHCFGVDIWHHKLVEIDTCFLQFSTLWAPTTAGNPACGLLEKGINNHEVYTQTHNPSPPI